MKKLTLTEKFDSERQEKYFVLSENSNVMCEFSSAASFISFLEGAAPTGNFTVELTFINENK